MTREQQARDNRVWKIIDEYSQMNPIKKQFVASNRPSAPCEISGISGVFWRLLESAQNASFRSKVIKFDTHAKLWQNVLCEFSPEKVYQQYFHNYKSLQHEIMQTFRDKPEVVWERTGDDGKKRDTTWTLFARCIVDSAAFLKGFAFDFKQFKEFIFNTPEQFKYILPFAISTEIHGLGYALACDFLKECPGLNFDIAKPDVHIREFCNTLDGREYSLIETVRRIHLFAQNVGKKDYDADKVIWAICAADSNSHKKDFLAEVKNVGV